MKKIFFMSLLSYLAVVCSEKPVTVHEGAAALGMSYAQNRYEIMQLLPENPLDAFGDVGLLLAIGEKENELEAIVEAGKRANISERTLQINALQYLNTFSNSRVAYRASKSLRNSSEELKKAAAHIPKPGKPHKKCTIL